VQIKSAKDLTVYQKAYALAMEIFEASKGFPAEEKYSLIDQMRARLAPFVQIFGRNGRSGDTKPTL
jgi:23S rRNA-intervening sequence protein